MGRKPTKETIVTITLRIAHDDELGPADIVDYVRRVLDDGTLQDAVTERIDDADMFGVVMSADLESTSTTNLTDADLKRMGFDPEQTPETDVHDADMAREDAKRRLKCQLEANFGGEPMWNDPELTYNGWSFSTGWSMTGTWGFSHPQSSVVVFCTPDWEKSGRLPISCETPLPSDVPDDMAGEEVACDVMNLTADGFFALVRPWLDKHQPKEPETVIFPRMLSQDELLVAHEFPAPMATVPNKQVMSAAKTYNTVLAAMDRVASQPDNRPEMPVDSVNRIMDVGHAVGYRGDDIYNRVLAAMQDAEEAGGPEGMRYIELMERIADTARRRADNYRARFRGGPTV